VLVLSAAFIVAAYSVLFTNKDARTPSQRFLLSSVEMPPVATGEEAVPHQVKARPDGFSRT
jgi:hypothetical protein